MEKKGFFPFKEEFRASSGAPLKDHLGEKKKLTLDGKEEEPNNSIPENKKASPAKKEGREKEKFLPEKMFLGKKRREGTGVRR